MFQALTPQVLHAQFSQHDLLLSRYQAYWQLTPFQHQQLPWHNPGLLNSLQSLSETQINQLELEPALALAHFAEFFPELSPCLEQWSLAPAKQQPLSTPFWFNTGIKGRKAEQIQAFSQQLSDTKLPILEWCAGKGHLGRLISFHHQLPVTSLEWQASLCEHGEQLAKQLNVDQHFHHCNVLNADSHQYVKPQQHAVALHACGELHLQLLRSAVQSKTQELSLCPCCYHLITSEHYQTLSARAKRSVLHLTRQDLRLAVAQSVTSGQRVQTLRQREIHWRLSYQCLREALSGETHYQALPSVAKHWFAQGKLFNDFAHWACQQHSLTAPANLDWQHYLRLGKQRHLLVRQIELVQHLFRPIMERWLLLDRALFLQEHGYQVGLTELFSFQTSPRNVLIQAALT
ncbi:methyltransferase [Agarivorans sp. Toyoura001]|uniref:methyltransferase n=1 Tax=Agarivorans sp. Toyoura001 TaxID=2283141 RepID=UPI0010E0D733|nr:methyltransferase [Agarivorans sp. Toyoura001]GDY26677.1 methyltransferase [Agarivorans sp. Toyoura001]